jgi:hypothetical protein
MLGATCSLNSRCCNGCLGSRGRFRFVCVMGTCRLLTNHGKDPHEERNHACPKVNTDHENLLEVVVAHRVVFRPSI